MNGRKAKRVRRLARDIRRNEGGPIEKLERMLKEMTTAQHEELRRMLRLYETPDVRMERVLDTESPESQEAIAEMLVEEDTGTDGK